MNQIDPTRVNHVYNDLPILALKKKFSMQNQTGKKIQAKPLQNWTKNMAN
jgi:hypothetical protein